jgi:hypothetical protein
MSDYAHAQERWGQYFRWCQLQGFDGATTDEEIAEYRRLTELFEEPGPDLCYTLAHELLGCTNPLPAWLYDELREEESLPDYATTYHAAAVELLTEHIIDGHSSSTWVRMLYPVFVKDAEIKGLPQSREGFEAWRGGSSPEGRHRWGVGFGSLLPHGSRRATSGGEPWVTVTPRSTTPYGGSPSCRVSIWSS